MKYGFVLSPLARQDLLDIWDHIALDNIDAADRLAEDLQDAMKKLASVPAMGHFRDELPTAHTASGPSATTSSSTITKRGR